MNKSGFTLVELLAVIIILSILALLASTSVTKIVRDSKNDLYNTQVELIKSAAEAWGADNLYKLPDAGACKYISLSDLQAYGLIDPKVKNPKTGKKFDKNTLIKITGKKNKFGLNNITYEVVSEATDECEYIYAPICTLVSGQPNTIGSKYECEVKKGTKYNFYVLSHELDRTTNLIMERNICEDGSLATKENTCLVAYNIDGDISDVGPVTAMKYLNNATSDWNNISNLNLTYNDEGGHFTNFKITGKARLPYKREVNAAGCVDQEALTCPLWMVDYLSDGGSYQENTIDVIHGYWTFSSYVLMLNHAWYVRYVGRVDLGSTTTSNYYGVRPVINVNLNKDINEDDIPEPKSFREDSWDVIAANVRIGNLSKYKVGDTKEITLTSDDEEIAGTYTVRIANTSTPSECAIEGFSQTACGFVIEFEDIISNSSMNSGSKNSGGWEASKMRSYVNNDIYNAFPEELKKNIIDTYVVSGYEEGKTENYKTTDKIYLLSTKEVWEDGEDNLVTNDSARDVTRQLDYYKQKGVTTSNYEGAIKNEEHWWLRSATATEAYGFYEVMYNGCWSSFNVVNESKGVSVAFRL